MNQVLENSIWKDQDEKAKFLLKHKRITNEFWLNVLGWLGLFQKYKNNPKLALYFKASPVRVERVLDDSSDLMVIIKQVFDDKLINDQILMNLTKLLAKIKQGSIDTIDENILRDNIIKKIKVSQVYPYPEVAAIIKDFNKGNKTLSELLPDIYQVSLNKKRALEFREMYKVLSHVVVDPNVVAPVAAPVSPVASALTGAPKGANTTPVVDPVVAQVTHNTPTIDDVKAYFTNITIRNNINVRFMFFIYLNEECKTESEMLHELKTYGFDSPDNLLRTLVINEFISIIKHFTFPQDIFTNYPAFVNLYKPYADDTSKLSDAFLSVFKEISACRMISLTRRFLKNERVSLSLISQLSGIVESAYISSSSTTHESDLYLAAKVWLPKQFREHGDDLMSYMFQNTEASMRRIVGDFFSKIVVEDWLSYLSDSTIEKMNIIQWDLWCWYLRLGMAPFKDAAVTRFYKLNDCPAKKWALDNMSFEDKVKNGLITFEEVFSNLYGNIKSYLPDHSFKDIVEMFGVSYDEFLDYLDSNSSKIFNILRICFSTFSADNGANNPFIELKYLREMMLLLFPKLGSSYISSDSSFFLRSLQASAYAKMYDVWDMIFDKIEEFQKKGGTINLAANMAYVKFPIGFDKGREVRVMKNILANRPSAYSFRNWDKETIFQHLDMFIEVFGTGGSNTFASFTELFHSTNYDLSTSKLFRPALTKALEFKTYDQFLLNDETLLSVKDVIAPFVLSRIGSVIADIKQSSYYEGVRDNLGNLSDALNKNIIEWDDFKKSLELYKKELFTSGSHRVEFGNALLRSIKDVQDFPVAIVSEVFDGDEIVELITVSSYLKQFRNLSNWNSTGWKIKVGDVAKAMDNIAPFFNVLYDKGGADLLIKMIKESTIQNVLSTVSSGKRLMNKVSNLDSIFLTILKENPKDIDPLLDSFPDKIRQGLVSGLVEKIAILPVLEDMYASDSPFKPYEKINSDRLRQLLQFNNFKFDGRSAKKKKKENYDEYFHRLSKDVLKDAVPPMKLEKVVETQDQLNEKTVEYSKYYNGKHGNSAVEFLETYDVKMSYPQFDEFTKRFPNTKLVPSFHGTSLLASNFLLRFGFTILPSNDSSIAGRMLDIYGMVMIKDKSLGNPVEEDDYIECIENGYEPVYSGLTGKAIRFDYNSDTHYIKNLDVVGGIYVSNIIEKTAQYIGNGCNRSQGTVGVIFEIEANLGTPGLHSHSAGLGNDSIRSPEWACCWPKGQLKITKAHKVRFATKDFVAKLKTQYPHAIKENKYFSNFAEYLTEESVMSKKNNMTYVFYQGLVPTENGTMIPWEDFEKKYVKNSKKMFMSSDQRGIAVTFLTDKEIDGYDLVPFTDEFMTEDKEGSFSRFLNLLKECKG